MVVLLVVRRCVALGAHDRGCDDENNRQSTCGGLGSQYAGAADRRGLAHFSARLIVASRECAQAEKCACPLAAEGDSPIFAANSVFLRRGAIAAAKIGTVPVNGYIFAPSSFSETELMQ